MVTGLLVAFSEKSLCLIDVLTATMRADGVSPGIWNRPLIDLFATSLNYKLETFVSPIPDQKAWTVDADEAVLHTIIVGDPGTKIVLAKPEL
jgi:hypothetical protein